MTPFQIEINSLIQRVGGYSHMSKDMRLLINVLALSGEAGEIANKFKKHCWYAEQTDAVLAKDIGEELGDVLYHVAQTATELGLDLDDIMAACIAKTKKKNGVK